jgi:subtilisin family serine protease
VGKVAAALAVVTTALLVTSAGSAATRDVGAPAGKNYTVAFASGSLPANVDQLVAAAGGTIVLRLPQIGGIGVVSANPSFAAQIDSVASVASAQQSSRTSIDPSREAGLGPFGAPFARHRASGAGADPQAEPDDLGSEQWDKMRMNVSSSGSYAVTQGSPSVHVALTDTGVDVTHPDIQANLDVADSMSFVSTEPTIQDFNGHGTWTASAVAAPINGTGISGVAPKVSLVELKTNDANGDGLMTSIDAALIYAGDHHFDVVSSSIIAYAPLCKGGLARKQGCDDADYLLAQRAVDYARRNGVTIVAALGNDNLDLSNSNQLGQVFGQPGGVVEVPGGLDGVIGVSATGYYNEKTYYSNYGTGVADIAAPGGDPHFQLPPTDLYGGGGNLLGAWSSTAAPEPGVNVFTDCGAAGCGKYALLHGTSMAAPNVAGVAALIVSKYGTPHLSPATTESILLAGASTQPCPTPSKVPYAVPPGLFVFDYAVCQGGTRSNGFYGSGIADALRSLSQP